MYRRIVMYMDDMEDDTSGGVDQVKSNFVQYLVIKCIIIMIIMCAL